MASTHEALNPIHPAVLAKMDPVFVAMYNEHVAKIPNAPIDLHKLRANYSKIYSYGTGAYPHIENVSEISFLSFDGAPVKLRIYRPNDAAADDFLPVHIDFHGGGGGLGDLETEKHVLCHYVQLARVAVVDVDYRLVPDYPYPTYIQDCFWATKFVYENAASLNFSKDLISVGGVSVGGNVALIVSHLARDAQIPLVLCLAGTPQVDDVESYKSAQDSPYESVREFEFAPTLNWSRITYFDKLKWQTLPTDATERARQLEKIGWFKNVMLAPDFAVLPKTVVVTAGCDPMRDEGEAYAAKLIKTGNEVVFKRYPGVPHPFMHMDSYLWQASDYIQFTAQELKRAHGR
ncbi:alpha/beta-hydrolase [Metschnikowia bicuspidata var. bicuspidata NRRL YB-4993]|uniref:Alpha/beta-hydrolase n=1 Tax=Metschnikowia bicuspidata var. bicuspidata NRRL YB-4993 TaxID=869754 RepID=A0A1A0HEG7_9ASCO|nr:alpha/beta-hydrolase [Metschnikowia bicuspidata var. bicuspidata NRRL YB-4993]OBA22380.1 alpha/beta-hydrolase [Metschnikowia bicuspidata var. bicuspidata NRRL YB-4993]